jgi:site-specific recombinase XerD
VKLIAACTTNQALRDKANIYFLFDSGVRAGELLALNFGDVDPISGQTRILHGKGDKFRVVFIGSKTRKALRAYLRNRGDLKPSAPLFVTDENERLAITGLRQIIKRCSDRAGIKEHGLHDFRRGCALNLLRNGCDLVTISRLLGHSSLVVTQRYLATDQQDLQEGHRRASPVDRM